MSGLVITTHFLIFGQMLILTRALGPELYGSLTAALVYQSYLFLFACTGLRAVALRETIYRPDAPDEILTAFLALTGSIATILCGMTFVGTFFVDISYEAKFLVCLLAAGNVAGAMNVLPLFDAHHRQLQSAAIALAVEFLSCAAFVLLAGNDWIALNVIAIVFISKWILNFAVHLLVYHLRVRPIRLRFDASRIQVMIRSAWPLLWSAVLATAPFSAGALLLSAAGTQHEVALLGLAQQAASSYLLLTTSALRFVQPRLAQAKAADRAARPIVMAFASFAAMLLVSLIGAAYLLTHFVLDERYAGAFVPMILMLAGASIHSLGSVAAAWLLLTLREKHVLAVQFAGTLVFLVGGLSLPSADAVGFATWTGVAAFMAALALAVLALRPATASGR